MKLLKEIFDALFKFTKDERLAIAVLAAGVVCIAAIRLIANRPLGSRVEVSVAAPVQATVKRADTLFQCAVYGQSAFCCIQEEKPQ